MRLLLLFPSHIYYTISRICMNMCSCASRKRFWDFNKNVNFLVALGVLGAPAKANKKVLLVMNLAAAFVCSPSYLRNRNPCDAAVCTQFASKVSFGQVKVFGCLWISNVMPICSWPGILNVPSLRVLFRRLRFYRIIIATIKKSFYFVWILNSPNADVPVFFVIPFGNTEKNGKHSELF